MPRLLPITGKKLCKLLEKKGFEKIGQQGSHVRYRHQDGRITVVPVHGNEELGTGILQEILSQTEIPRNEYLRLRRKV
ncbi:MAG: type II toxin-antitoxin system HicA family toxin [Candidatus Woesearchaeota archaeon]|nr:type II toxin-antitoxin system HicA family toxin [Candidatus Woesearchaeota archaeon]